MKNLGIGKIDSELGPHSLWLSSVNRGGRIWSPTCLLLTVWSNLLSLPSDIWFHAVCQIQLISKSKSRAREGGRWRRAACARRALPPPALAAIPQTTVVTFLILTLFIIAFFFDKLQWYPFEKTAQGRSVRKRTGSFTRHNARPSRCFSWYYDTLKIWKNRSHTRHPYSCSQMHEGDAGTWIKLHE